MKTKNLKLAFAVSAIMSGSIAFAEAEVTGKVVHESAKYTTSGTTIGAASSHDKDAFKAETSVRLFIDGDASEIYDGATYHVELQGFEDSKAISDYQGTEAYTQRDALREAYVDAEVNDWSIRAGKQQVVWGTADGMKLLDALNPTDYSEMAQNQMEDSRIPVWMVNAERDLEDGSNVQVVLSQQKANVIAGLNADGDQGHPFIMKGVDSITGKTNGFLNVTPALAKVASTFDFASAGDGTTGGFQQATGADITNAISGGFAVSGWNGSSSTLAPFTGTTVDGFASYTNYDTGSSIGQMLAQGQTGANGIAWGAGDADNNNAGEGNANTNAGKDLLFDMAQNSTRNANGSINTTMQSAYGNQNVTNLINHNGTSTIWDVANPTSAFEYMPNATFSTFNTFAGATTEYVKDSNAQDGVNVGFRTKNATEGGLNYSFNVLRRADANPYIDMSWRDKTTGEKLNVILKQGGNPNTGLPSSGTTVTAADVVTSPSNLVSMCTDQTDVTTCDQNSGLTTTNFAYKAGQAYNATTVLVQNANGDYYGIHNPDTGATNSAALNSPVLRFTEKSKDITSIGGSFDATIETEEFGGVVIRGEAMLNKGEMTPVVNRKLLAIGDLTGALSMKESDIFRYVLGVDITALTNMLVSTQLIQIRNLDYVDNACTGTTQMGNSYDCSEYTADMSTMHLTNGLNKAEENKEFYSLFLSKPFGASGEHRWNNIFMFEENGGKWNRLDVEFSIDDNTQVTAEYNKYWGDENTQFGQLEKSSNVQIGFKYSF